MDRNILQPQKQDNEIENKSLRPKFLDDFLGQSKLKDNLKIFIQAAKLREEPLDHTLLYGPPGLGKTTIAQVISNEIGSNFRTISGPAISKPADLAAILTNTEEKDVLFIDEIHRLNINLEEILYSAMEDFSIDIIIGEGPSARSVKIPIQNFTLIGATTRLGLLSSPLRDRFGIPLRINFYTVEELTAIISRGANKLSVSIEDEGAHEIAQRSRGTPRIALRLLKRVRDFAQNNTITKTIADFSLNKLEVDTMGLDSNDYRYLNFIARYYNGGPVGIDTIAAGLSEQKDTIEDAIEPYLIQIGFIQRTARGRVLTYEADGYLGRSLR